MNKTEGSLALLTACLAISACVTAYTSTTTASARVPVPPPRTVKVDGGAPAAPRAAEDLELGALGDPNNCGCCGTICASDQLCIDDVCTPRAPACAGGCNPDVYECNIVVQRCVGNGSPSVNLCRWDTAVSGAELLCGRSATVTVVDACSDPKNCGNCGVVCPSGKCFWGVCQ